MSNRAEQVIADILRRIHEAIVENDVTYEEYQAAKQWFIDVGEAGEAANAALTGELGETQRRQVEELLAVSERVLRRRRVLRG